MRACSATALFCWFACLLGGCSLTTKFDHFKFGSAGGSAAGSSAADGGMIDSGSMNLTDSGSAGSNGDAGLAVDSGSSGQGAGGAGGSGGGAAGSAGASGAGGQGAATCVTDSDCGDPATFNCVLKHCVVRRLPSGVWFSGGGGITQSASFVLRASIGAPAPMGKTSSGNFSITVGPGAGRP